MRIMILLGAISTHKIALQDSCLLNRKQLLQIKNKAMRAGVWFKALTRLDRVLIDLTIKVVDNIRSSYLTKSLLDVIGKLEGKLESSFLASLRKIGHSLAQKISLIAQEWGNASAKDWSADSAFAIFLAVMHRNR